MTRSPVRGLAIHGVLVCQRALLIGATAIGGILAIQAIQEAIGVALIPRPALLARPPQRPHDQ